MAWDKVDCLKSDMSFGMYVLDYCKDSRAHYLSQETSLYVCRPSPHMIGHTWLQAHNSGRTLYSFPRLSLSAVCLLHFVVADEA